MLLISVMGMWRKALCHPVPKFYDVEMTGGIKYCNTCTLLNATRNVILLP